MKRVLTLALCAMLAAPAAAQAGKLSDWAVPGYEAANSAGLVPYSIAANNLTGNITRGEFCEIVMNLYNMMKGEETELADCPFTDTDSFAVKKAYSLGIINGKTETEFCPDDYITRQEIAKIVMGAVNAADKEAHVTAEDFEKLCIFEDFGDTADWAAADVAKSVKYDILNGVSETQIVPRGAATREQAITIVSRAAEAFAQSQSYYQPPQIDNLYDGLSLSDKISVSWERAEGAKSYAVFVYDEAGYCVLMQKTKGTSLDADTSKLTYNRSYTITVGAEIDGYTAVYSEPVTVYYGTEQSVIETLPSLTDRYNRVFPGGVPFATEEEAAYNMVSVSVPVWKMKDSGEKYSSTAWLTVNRNLADEVVKIFTEIYNDPEQFPIKDAGGYSWRMTASGTTQSQHSYGTCIDINYNENYYYNMATGQAITGSFWKPYENPYSIPENGSVVRAFAKYGWSWGGNAWTTMRDYMHFTYLGK